MVSIFIVTVRFVGIDFFFEPRVDMPLIELYSASLPGGILLGLLWGLIEIIDNRVKRKRRRVFGVVLVSKTLIYTLTFMFIAFFASWFGSNSLEWAINYMTSPFLIINFLFIIIAAFLFLFFNK